MEYLIKYKRCRICLSEENLTKIFMTKLPNETSLARKIVYCTSVQISPGDGLPMNICKTCESYLNIAYAFKIICRWTDSVLREENFSGSTLLNTVKLYEKLQIDFNESEKYENLIENVLHKSQCDISKLFKQDNILHDDHSNNFHLVETDEHLTRKHAEKTLIIKEFIDDDISITEEIVYTEDAIKEASVLVNTSELSVGITEDALNFNYDYIHHNIDDNKAVYRRVSLNSEDPLLLNVINKDSDANELKGSSKELKEQDKKNDNLKSVSLNDFENFEKKMRKADEDHSKRIKMASKNRVGRHIAKKNAGQPPKRYNRSLELAKSPEKVNRNNENIRENKKRLCEEKVETKDVHDMILQHEYFLEGDLPLPEPMFEETIITDSFYLTNNDDSENNNDDQQQKDVKVKIRKKRGCQNKSIIKNYRNKNKKISKSNRKASQQKLVKTCKICNKSFPFPSHLERHLTSHIGIKHYSCKYCNKQFLHRYNLSVHIRKHTGDFPLHCDVCNMGFASPSVLQRHKISHTGETPHQCRYCKRQFSHASSLTLHEQMHINRPSITCEVCFKVFSYKSSYNAHKKTHSGSRNQKPHSCSVCHKKFTKRTSVVRHMVCHSDVKKLKCDTCDCVFNTRNSLANHRKACARGN